MRDGPRGGGTGSPSRRIRRAPPRGGASASRSGPAASGASRRAGASARGPVTESLVIVLTRPERGDPPRQARLRPQAMSETAIRRTAARACGRRRAGPATPTSRRRACRGCRRAAPAPASPRAEAAPAAERGQVGDQSGVTIEPGTLERAPPRRRWITSEQTSRSEPGIVKHLSSTWTRIESDALGLGKSRIVRDGCSSSRPASVRRAAAAQFGGAHATG